MRASFQRKLRRTLSIVVAAICLVTATLPLVSTLVEGIASSSDTVPMLANGTQDGTGGG